MTTLAEAVRAIRYHALGIVAASDELLRAITPAEVAVADAPCAHPDARRIPAPRMGMPGAWICACGQEGGI